MCLNVLHNYPCTRLLSDCTLKGLTSGKLVKISVIAHRVCATWYLRSYLGSIDISHVGHYMVHMVRNHLIFREFPEFNL